MTLEMVICFIILIGLLFVCFYPRISYRKKYDDKRVTPRTIIKTSKVDIKIALKVIGGMIIPLYLFYDIGKDSSESLFLQIILILVFSIIPVLSIIRLYRIFNRKYVIIEDTLVSVVDQDLNPNKNFLSSYEDVKVEHEDVGKSYLSLMLSSNYNLFLYIFDQFYKCFKKPLVVTDEDLPSIGNQYYIVVYKGLECVFDKQLFSLSDKDKLSSIDELKAKKYIKLKNEAVVNVKLEKTINKYSKVLKGLYLINALLPYTFIYFFLSNHTFSNVLPIFSLIFFNLCVSIALFYFYVEHREYNRNSQVYLLYGNGVGIISLILNIIIYILFF